MWVKESGGGLADVLYLSGGKAIKVARLVPSGSLGRSTSAARFYSVPYRGAFTIDLHTRNARTGIKPLNVFLLELQIWVLSAELFQCKFNEMSWVTPEEKQVLLNKVYSFLRFCQVTCVKWFYVLVVHWHIWSVWSCLILLLFFFLPTASVCCRFHCCGADGASFYFVWTSPHLFFFLSHTLYDTLWHALSHLFSSQLLF